MGWEREWDVTVEGLGIDKTGLHTCQLLTSETDKKYKNSTKITTKTTAKRPQRTNYTPVDFSVCFNYFTSVLVFVCVCVVKVIYGYVLGCITLEEKINIHTNTKYHWS